MSTSPRYGHQKIQGIAYYVLFYALGIAYLLCPYLVEGSLSEKVAALNISLVHTGYISFGLFFFLLALNPLTKFRPQLPLVGYFNCFRRQIGLGSFWFLCVHFYASGASANLQAGNRLEPTPFTAVVYASGFFAFLIFLFLAATSNNYFVARLGPLRWKRWQKTAYIAQWLAFIHLVFQGGLPTILALGVGLPLFAIQWYRWRSDNFLNMTPAWEGFRPLVITEKRKEAVEGIYTFYLKDPKRKKMPPYHPGQYLMLSFDIPGIPEPVVRAYSLSNWRARPEWYRFTVKQVVADANSPRSQDGLVSNYLANEIREGTVLQVKAPQGHFVLDPYDDKPLVLIGGGIGVTPLLSMIPALLLTKRKQDFWFFYSVKNSDFEYLREDLARVESEYPNFHRHVFYSDNDAVIEGGPYHRGRITVDKIKAILPSMDFDFYMCGPTGMLQGLVLDLGANGVPHSKLHYETFDPSTFISENGKVEESCEVTFKRSSIKTTWKPEEGSILQLAKKHGIKIPVNCRMGNCGMCSVAILSGSVSYPVVPTQAEEGQCLTCIARPSSDLELDC